jgi:hypothetical protein
LLLGGWETGIFIGKFGKTSRYYWSSSRVCCTKEG